MQISASLNAIHPQCKSISPALASRHSMLKALKIPIAHDSKVLSQLLPWPHMLRQMLLCSTSSFSPIAPVHHAFRGDPVPCYMIGLVR
eukprot:1137778-Pelagomonas_calceolata.AAC.4